MPKLFTSKHRGFTLIELMITVAIIAILSSVGFVTYSKSQQVARDGRRKNDLKSLSVALELYYQENKYYPCSNQSGAWIVSTSTSFPINHVTAPSNPTACPNVTNNLDIRYINAVPVDPSRNTTSPMTNGGYGYRSYFTAAGCTPGQQYVLVTLLENSGDVDRHQVKQYKDCNGNVFPVGGAGNFDNNDYFVTSY